MQSLHDIKKYRLVAYVQERKEKERLSIRQLARNAGVNKSTVERFLRNGCLDMVFKDAVPLLLLLGITPTQAADMLGLVGPLPQNKEDSDIIEAAWKLSQLDQPDRHALIGMIDSYFQAQREVMA